jgi:hypothetical protein
MPNSFENFTLALYIECVDRWMKKMTELLSRYIFHARDHTIVCFLAASVV